MAKRQPLPKAIVPDEELPEVTDEAIESVMMAGDVLNATAAPEEPDVESHYQPELESDPQSDLLGRLTAALENLATNNTQNQPQSEMAAAIGLLAQAVNRITESQMAGANRIADATIRAQRPDNMVAPQISVFNLRGDKDFPKPQPLCEVFLPWPADWDSMTREECEIVNLIVRGGAGDFLIRRSDNTKLKIQVRVITKFDSDEPSRVIINHDTGFNNDNHRLMPPDWLRQLARSNPKIRKEVDSVLTMEEEEALILAGKLNDGSIPDNGRVVSVGSM